MAGSIEGCMGKSGAIEGDFQKFRGTKGSI
jgi:hypothetical protein